MSFRLLRHLRRNITQFQTRNVTYMPRPGDGSPRALTLIPGDGIGPLVTDAVEQVMEAMHAPVYFEKYDVHGNMNVITSEVIESVKKNKACLKGGLATPVGGGVSSLNMQLRKELDLYASLVNCFNLPGLPTRHENVDIVVIRENTEGEYSGLEHEVVPGVVKSLKKSMTSFRSMTTTSFRSMTTTSFRSMTTTIDAEPASTAGNITTSPNVNQPERIKFKRLDKTAKHIMNILDKEAVDSVRGSREIPDIKPGYIVQLKVEVPENKRRVSTLKGIVIARRNAGLNTTFRLRRMVAGVGVESVFPLYSPNIKEVKIIDKKKVRRAKLYYLRDRMNALKK